MKEQPHSIDVPTVSILGENIDLNFTALTANQRFHG
jgi:hypothetical protein